MKRITLLIYIFIFTAAAGSAAAQTVRQLSLEESMDIALQSSYEFKRQELDFKSSYYNLKAQRARLRSSADMKLFLPSFEESIKQEFSSAIDGFQFVSTNQLRFQSELEIRQPVPTGGDFSLNAEFYYRDQKTKDDLRQRDYFGRVFMRFRQPILQPNELKNDIEFAEIGLTNTRLEYAQDKARSINWMTGRFYDIYRSQETIQYLNRMVSQYESAYSSAENKVRARNLDETELLTIQVDLENIKSELVRLESDRQNSEERFKQQIGLDRTVSIQVVSVSDIIALNATLDEAVELAMQNRVEIIRMQNWMRTNEIRLDRIKSRGRLTGEIDATFGYDNSEEQFIDIFDEYDKSQSIMFTFELPILDWGRNKAERQEKQVEIERIRNEQLNLSRRIIREVTDAYRRVEDSIGRLELLVVSRRDAERSYNLSLEQFDTGQISAQDVRLSRQRFQETQDRYLNAFVDYQRNLANLNTAAMWNFQENKSLITEEEINALIQAVDNNDNE